MYGLDSQFTHFLGIGDQGSSGRNSFDFVQGDLAIRIPVRQGLSVEAKAGMFVTPMGFESLDPTRNVFYSNSYIFNFGLPRKHTGLLTTTHVGDDVDVFLGYTTGANTSLGPGGGYDDTQPHLLGGVAVRLSPVTIEAFTHIGPEDAPSLLPPGADAHRALRYYDDLYVTWTVTPALSIATEFNYVRDDGLKADAGGVAQYLTLRLSPRLSAGLRAEVWRDDKGVFVAGYPGNLDYLDAEEGAPNGAFRPGPATYGEVTFGLDLQPSLKFAERLADSPFWQITVRPEIRYDRILAGDSGFGATPGSARDQVTLAVDVVVPLSFRRQASPDAALAAPAPAPWTASASAGEARAWQAPPRQGPASPPAGPSEAIATLPDGDSTPGAGPARLTAESPAPAAPMSDGAVSAQALAITNPQTLQDINGYLPDVTLALSPSGGAAAPYIRGIGDAAAHTGQAPAVGLNLDGVAIDAALAQVLDPGALSAVAVAYGPSGLFEGREAVAGVIDFERARPTRAWGVDAEYALEQGFHASDERVRLDAPVGRTAGLDISLSHRQRGGYDDDVYSGDPLYGRVESTVGAIRFDWSVTPALDADLSLTFAHADGQGTPLALGDTLDAQLLGPSLRAQHPSLQFNAYGSPYLPGQTQPLGPYQTAADGPDGQSLTARIYSLTLTDDSAAGRLTAITAYFAEDRALGEDLDGGCAGSDLGGQPCPVIANPLVGVLQAAASDRYDQFSQALRLDHDFGRFAELRLGGYFQDDHTDHAQVTRTILDPAGPSPAAGQTSNQDETSYALFANLTLHPTQRLQVSGGVRWAHDQERYALADTIGATPGAGVPEGPSLAGDMAWGRLLSRFALDYRLTDGISLYADRATGFRPGGLSLGSTLAEEIPGQPNFQATAPRANYATFAPETDTAYELGSRFAVLGGALTGHVSGYLTHVSGMQTPELVLTPGFAEAFDTYVVNLPRVETKGAEVDVAWRPALVEGLTLTGLGGYESARITDGLVSAAQAPVTASSTAGAAGASFDLTGTPLVRAPTFNATARADYTLEIGPGRCTFDLAYLWTARYALAVTDGQADWQPAFGVVDFAMAYQRSFYKITVTARNILNKTYDDVAIPAFFTHAWGEPRTVVVSLEARF
jgi:outer membrane receptor protein involved in Fe transport